MHDTPNGTGSELEKLIETTIESRQFVRGEDYCAQFSLGINDIFEYESRVDWFIWKPNLFPDGLYIEAKSQTSAGTADRKIPYLYLNIEERYNRPTVVVLDGDHLERAYQFLKQRESQKLVGVFTLTEFRQWWKQMHPLGKQKRLFYGKDHR